MMDPRVRYYIKVMHHYRSLDSGLSSPDDFEQDFNYDATLGTEHVLNSTPASQTSPIQGSTSGQNLKLQIPCRTVDSTQETKDLVILRSSKDAQTRKETTSEGNHGDGDFQRHLLKSASASDVLEKAITASPSKEDVNTVAGAVSFQLNKSKQSEIYLSADNITRIKKNGRASPRRGSKTSPLVTSSNRSSFSSPRGSRQLISSASDLSLSTDDLAFNFLLQSQIRHSSSASSLEGDTFNKLSFPSFDNKAHSTWDLSPRKYEVDETDGNLIQCESLSVLHRRSFTDEEFFVVSDHRASTLAQEAVDAADVLKEKKEQLKELIDTYREAEISRVEVEKENMRRARENEAIFSRQQKHLEELIEQQTGKLSEARCDLKEFQSLVALEKQKQRKNVEHEVDSLLRLKEEHLPYLDWSDHELRKKKFKMKVKIEDYWKRMDLYETLLLELELERSKVKQETDEKLEEKIKQFEQEQSQTVNEICEQIAVSEHDLETYTVHLEEETKQESHLNNTLHSTENEYNRKIGDAERFCVDVKEQEVAMLTECKVDIERVSKQIQDEEEKLHHYTIYKMHECDNNEGTCQHEKNNTDEIQETCKLAEEKQRSILGKLNVQKLEIEAEYTKKVDKYSSMLAHGQDALADLRENKIAAVDRCENDIEGRQNSSIHLEQRIRAEAENCKNLQNELKAHERPRSFISAFPEESEEDMIESEQQIEQLLQSKEKVRKILETALQEEFRELKKKREIIAVCESDTEKSDSSAVDKALSLVFHAGNSSAYMNSLVKKNNQFEQRRRTLTNIGTELQDLMKYQMTLHREVAENFLTQKSLFEEVRSQERKDIHATIQTLISDNDDDGEDAEKDQLLSRIFKESQRIIDHQKKLDTLENQMYEKITENYDLQGKLDKLSESINTFTTENTLVSPEKMELSNEYDALNAEKVKCENLITELQERLFVERKEYLELLKCKDGYDVIGQEYRDERQTSFQTEGNNAAADALREVFMAENIMDIITKSPQESKITCGGWGYIGKQKDICLFRKRNTNPNIVSMMGRGIIKASPKVVWETVRNPLSRLIYDKLIKKINIIEHFTDQLKVVYMQHQTRLFLMKQKKDCCCVHNERVERNKYIATHTSVEHPDCPEKKNYSRIKILPSGWILEPYTENGEDWCLAWYLIQVDVGKGYLPSYFLDSIVQKLPLSILSLRDYLVLS